MMLAAQQMSTCLQRVRAGQEHLPGNVHASAC
jgi:hypothetical protein